MILYAVCAKPAKCHGKGSFQELLVDPVGPRFSGGFSYVIERYGRHDWIRTSDLYRVNFEVNNLKPFACLAFPHITHLKHPGNSLFLVTSW